MSVSYHLKVSGDFGRKEPWETEFLEQPRHPHLPSKLCVGKQTNLMKTPNLRANLRNGNRSKKSLEPAS